MHYEEKVIDGALHFRTTPDGEWVQMPIEFLTGQYMALKASTEAYNPMTPLHSIQICGKEFIWDLSLSCTGGFIGLDCVEWDYVVVSTGVGEFSEILSKATRWHNKILGNPTMFSCLIGDIDDVIKGSKKWFHCHEVLEDWLDA